MDILFFLILVFEILLFLAYGIFVFYDMNRRISNIDKYDDNMLNTGRIISWVSVLAIIAISRNIKDNFYLFFFLFNILQLPYYIGFRLKNLGIRVNEENKDTFYYNWDRWIERMYGKYLLPLWNKRNKDKKN